MSFAITRVAVDDVFTAQGDEQVAYLATDDKDGPMGGPAREHGAGLGAGRT